MPDPETQELSEAKRALLERYLRGERPQNPPAGEVLQPQAQITQMEDFRQPILAIQCAGSKRPFFFLHGQWTGDAFYCYPLAQGLGGDQPFYLLEPYRMEEVEIPPTMEEVAAAHVKLLRSIQPSGPYL